MSSELKIAGVIFLERKSRKSLRVERYDLASDFSDSIRALCAENKALGKIWESDSFDKMTQVEDGKYKFEHTPSRKLAIEALEYYVLHSLSVHLTDYFNHGDDVDEEEIKELTRSDFPQVLLENRFIDMFSRPLEEREAFQSHAESPGGKVVYAIGAEGQLYDDFDFTLPKDAMVSRKGHGVIEVRTARFSLKISCDIGGTSVSGGFDFVKLYLGRKWDEIEAIKCYITLNVQFFPLQAISRKGWQYYRWLDSFLDRIERDASFKYFLKQIAWEKALTIETIREHKANPANTRGSRAPRRTIATPQKKLQ